ncbi:hypothetical protein CR513_06826, partial [Mucuna pruriens]
MIKDNPKEMTDSFFPKSFHYIPNNPLKTQRFNEFVLVDTDYVEITHTRDNKDNINQPLFDPKPFSRMFNPTGYTYYDYMKAWSNILYINPEKHSWFVWLKRGITLKFPKWFVKWFYNFGPTPNIFPLDILEVYNYFRDNSTYVPRYKLVSFVASQSITWILAWEYLVIPQFEDENIELKLLTRRIKVRWWKKFNHDLISKAKKIEWLKTNKSKNNPIHKTELNKESLFLLEKQHLMVDLVASTSAEEFFNKEKSIQGTSSQDKSDEGSNQSNSYLRNEDMFD